MDKQKKLLIAGGSALGAAVIVFASLFTWKCVTGGNGGQGGGDGPDRNAHFATYKYHLTEDSIVTDSIMIPDAPQTIDGYKTVSFEYAGYLGQIDWGDGSEPFTSDEYTGFVRHTYENAVEGSTYQINVYGNFTTFSTTRLDLTIQIEQATISLYDYGSVMIDEIEFAEGVTVLPERCAALMENINKITFPTTLKEISTAACFDLGGVIMPSNNTSNTSTITKIELPEGLRKIGMAAFAASGNITEIILPSTLQTIGADAFSACTGLEEITIPDNVTSIDGGALYYNASLTKINISENSKLIYLNGISTGMETLTSFPTFPKNLEYIGAFCFNDYFASDAPSEELHLPETVRFIGAEAFGFTSHIKGELLDLSHVEYVGQNAFTSAFNTDSVTAEKPITIKVPKDYKDKWNSQWCSESESADYIKIVEA